MIIIIRKTIIGQSFIMILALLNAMLRYVEFPLKISHNLIYQAEEGFAYKYIHIWGIPQGSVFGPLLWNVMYDGNLRLNLPANAEIIGFADHIAILLVAKNIPQIEFSLDPISSILV